MPESLRLLEAMRVRMVLKAALWEDVKEGEKAPD
jgi:hypothetical protein